MVIRLPNPKYRQGLCGFRCACSNMSGKKIGEYFKDVAKYLRPNGVALIHGITRQGKGANNGWFEQVDFPGWLRPRFNGKYAAYFGCQSAVR